MRNICNEEMEVRSSMKMSLRAGARGIRAERTVSSRSSPVVTRSRLRLRRRDRGHGKGGVGAVTYAEFESWGKNRNSILSCQFINFERDLRQTQKKRYKIRQLRSKSLVVRSSNVNETSQRSPVVSPRVDFLDGSKRISNYIYAGVVTLGGTGFFLTGLSSFVKFDLLPIIHHEGIQTFPQGITLVFYGTCGLLLATYLWLLCNWNVGGGTNEYDVEKGEVTITRLGYPGKNRRIVVKLAMEDVTGIRVEVDDGFQPRRAIYLQSKVRPDICLTPVGTPWTLERLEENATSLARLIRKPLRGDI